MTNVRTGDAIVAESFLDVRAKLLEIAATLDRIDRASDGATLGDRAGNQRDLLLQATEILLSDGPDRAARLQQLFSRQYEPDWRDQFGFNEAERV
ncbi:MAG: hypothetical protein KDB00_07720 [Planctomycetales bacterium]|nr:hypothetical protein [Planctomycetales bacterium]